MVFSMIKYIQAYPAREPDSVLEWGVGGGAKITRKKSRNNNTFGRFGGPNKHNTRAERPWYNNNMLF